jgi:outer membrane protein assembly factor BamB
VREKRVITPENDPQREAIRNAPPAEVNKHRVTPSAPKPAKAPKRSRFIWAVCAALTLVLVGLVLYQLYARRTIFAADAALLRQLQQQTIASADDRPLDPKSWPQWRGQRRDGVTTAPDLLVNWPKDGPKELWRVKGGDGYSSFAVRGDSAYTMLGSADGKQLVVALNVATGEPRWSRECGSSSGSDHGNYGGPRATPTLDGDSLYTVSSWGLLLCLDAATGKVKWQKDMVEEVGARVPRWGFATSPLIEGDRVYVVPGGGNGKSLAAFDKATGKLIWASENDKAGYSSPIVITSGGVRQIVYLTGDRLVGVTPDGGKVLWQFEWHDRFNVNAATPVFVRGKEGGKEDDYLFISSGYHKGCALVKLTQPKAGTFEAKAVYESNELCCHFGSPVLHGGQLYAADETRDLTCLDVRTGEVKWRKSGFKKGALLRVDDRLIILGEQGHLALVDCNAEEYREVARSRPFRGRCWTMPVLADGRVYLRDQSEIVCLDVSKGRE